LENISARALLERIVSGEPWTPEMADAAASDPNFFRDLVEPLADAFDPTLAAEYVRLFSHIVSDEIPDLRASDLISRYERIRHPRKFDGPDPMNVFVLSRVTFGAEVAITSVVLDAALKRFPSSNIFLVAPKKSWQLFAANQRVLLLVTPYDRGATLKQKLALSRALATPCSGPDTIVVDPDSRLTQLGLVPICPEDRYFYLDTRSLTGPGPLSQITARWMKDTFGVAAKPWIACERDGGIAEITVSLGVGGNMEKRLPDPFERRLLEMLTATGRNILIDKGAGGEETERVERAIAGLPNVETWQGEFAPFAGSIARSWLFVGYDSAGQHVAAATGTRLITIFAGAPNERFFERWRPAGKGHIDVIRSYDRDPGKALAAVERALASL